MYILDKIQDSWLLILKYLLLKWYIIIIALLAGIGLGYFIFSKVKPTYTSSFIFALSTEQKSNNALSGLATQLGINSTQASSDNIFSGDNILDLFKSRSLIGNALQFEIDSAKHLTLLNYIAKVQYAKIYDSTGVFNTKPSSYNLKQLKLFRKIITDVSKSYVVFKKDKRLVFYIMSATSTDPKIAYYVSKILLDETAQYFIDTKTTVTKKSIRLLMHEADSIGNILNHTFASTADLVDRTYNINPSLTIQRSGLAFNQSRANALGVGYSEIMRNLEASKFNLQQETPLYKVIDSPELPLNPVRDGVLKKTAIVSIICAVLTSLIISGIYVRKLVVEDIS